MDAGVAHLEEMLQVEFQVWLIPPISKSESKLAMKILTFSECLCRDSQTPWGKFRCCLSPPGMSMLSSPPWASPAFYFLSDPLLSALFGMSKPREMQMTALYFILD